MFRNPVAASSPSHGAVFSSEPMAPTFGTIVTAGPLTDPAALDAQADALREAVRVSGAVLLRGFRFDLAALEAFSSHFSERAVVHPSTVQSNRRPVTETTATVDGGVLPFPWHSELAYAPRRPDLVIFACERPSTQDDPTLLTDGCAIADRLSPAARAIAGRAVRYTYHRFERAWPVSFGGASSRREAKRALREIAFDLPPNEALTWRFRRRDGGRQVNVRYTTPMLSTVRWGGRQAFCNHVIFQERRRPADVVVLDDGSQIPATAVDEFERLADAASYAIRWREGDVAVVDNSRVMHARGPVRDPARRILARACQASF
jgi:alpha-ketoglutarate-dependent taurine dioxygenase